VEPDQRGDPVSPQRWTTKSTRNLAGELTCQGHRVGAGTVGDLLRAEGFSLQGSAKTLEGQRHPDRRAGRPGRRDRAGDHPSATSRQGRPGTSKWNKVEHRLFSHITMDVLPLSRHHWHGDWNYTLRPGACDQDAGVPGPFDRPSPDLAWLCRPALTGLPAAEWDALTAALLSLHDQQRETSLDKRRGHRPRLTAPGTGRRPVLTLAGRLLAAILHYRLALPQVAIAALFGVRPETVNKRIRDIRQLLDQAGHTIQPGPHRLASLDDLYDLARSTGIAIQPEIKTAC
jgi:hypothetical protein